jgi:hypothetical protein
VPSWLTVTPTGLRYKKQIWPKHGDICRKCNVTQCTNITSGFGKDVPYTHCLKCKRKVVVIKRSSLNGYLSYIAYQMNIRCRHTGRTCAINLRDIYCMWEKQSGRCAISGIRMTHSYDIKVTQRLITNASIDRIDSDFGYIKSNVQLVCVRVNLMKGVLDQSMFFNLCSIIANYEPYYNVSN